MSELIEPSFSDWAAAHMRHKAFNAQVDTEVAGEDHGALLWAVASPNGVMPVLNHAEACKLAHSLTSANADTWARVHGPRLGRAEIVQSPYQAAEHYRRCAEELSVQLEWAMGRLQRACA